MSHKAGVLLVFQSIHQVLAAEKVLVEGGVSSDLVPVPKEVSPNCGMAIVIAAGDRARALALLERTPPLRMMEDWAP